MFNERLRTLIRTGGAAARMLACLAAGPLHRHRERRPLALAWQGGPVRIERDAHGVPRIEAASEAALYFGQGHACATDRLWQMDMFRRQALGRLSEVLGAGTVAIDRFHRNLRLGHFAHQALQELSPRARGLLDAYVAGINAAATRLRERPPFEFRMLGYQPDAWTPADTLALVKLMGLRLGMNAKYKACMHELVRALGPRDAAFLAASMQPDDYVTVRGGAARGETPVPLAQACPAFGVRPLLGLLGQAEHTGSNAWVVAGQRSRSGRPMLCNDPHLPLGLPALFHHAHLVCTQPGAAFEAAGANAPGLPGIVSGHNAHIAWGITNSQVDVQDLLLVDAGAALFPALAPHRAIETIAVRDGAPQAIDVEVTALGPTVDAWCEGLPPGKSVVFAWSGLAGGQDVEGLFDMPRARDWPQFKAALSCLQTLSLNVLFAAADGDIAMKTTGRVPVRAKGLQHAIQANDWTGFVAFDDLPEVLNPSSGVIVNCNNPIADDAHRAPLTTLWNPSHRAWRVSELLAQRARHAPDDMRALQADIVNGHARLLAPLLVALLEPLAGVRAPAFARALRLLAAWDHADRRDSPAAALWHAFVRELGPAVLGDVAAPLLVHFENLVPSVTRLVVAATRGELPPWMADQPALRCRVADALARAIEQVSEAGRPVRWGERHRLGFRHPLSPALGALRRLTDLAGHEWDGSSQTVALAAGAPRVLEGAVWSMVATFEDTGTAARSLLLPGQSGDCRSRWFGDQFALCVADRQARPVATFIQPGPQAPAARRARRPAQARATASPLQEI